MEPQYPALRRFGLASLLVAAAALHIPRTVVFGALSLPDPDTERLPTVAVGVRVVPTAGHSVARENPSGLALALACGHRLPRRPPQR